MPLVAVVVLISRLAMVAFFSEVRCLERLRLYHGVPAALVDFLLGEALVEVP